MIFLLSANFAYSGTWDKSLPDSTDAKLAWPAASQANNDSIDRMLSNYREGMRLTYSSGSTVIVSSGEVMLSNSAGTLRLMMNNASSTNVTFSNLDTGLEASGTKYYVYAIAASAASETATFKISENASIPSGPTYYKRLGSFTNDGSSNMTVIANDNENSIIVTGTIPDAGTISLPSGWSQDECDWTVSGGTIDGGTSTGGAFSRIDFTVNSSRVVNCDGTKYNWVDGATTSTITGTCNYIIACYR